MKTHNIFLVTLTISAALAGSVQAGSHRGHNAATFAPATGRGAAPGRTAARGQAGFAGYRSGNFRYTGGRMIGSQQRFATMRSGQLGYNPYSVRSGRNSSFGSNRFSSMRDGATRATNTGSFNGTRFSARNTDSFRGGNRSFSGANNHVFAQRSANWQRGWDRNRDHWWHGHRCRFINNSWVIFDLGFYPWYGYSFYPSYYSNYYPYYYDQYPDYYGGEAYQGAPADDYSDQGAYDAPKEGTDSPVSAAQTRLARQGYYRGEIDGLMGPETRRAIMRYQSDNGLAPTGQLNDETLQSLGMR